MDEGGIHRRPGHGGAGERQRAAPGRRVASASAALLLMAVAGCAPGDATPEVRVGVLATLEGRFAETSGTPTLRGAELAADEWNQEGGVLIGGVRHRVRLVVRSYDSRADDAATQARALINQDSVHALLGPQLSSHAIPVAVVADDAGVVMISPMSSNAETTSGKRFVFRLAFLDAFQARVLARFAREELGAGAAAVLYEESSAYSSELAREFSARFREAGGRVVAEERFLADAPQDYSGQLGRIRAARPDVLLLPNAMAADSVQVRQAREAGLDIPILGTDTWDLQLTQALTPPREVYVTHQWHWAIPGHETKAFVARFQALHGRLPRTTAAMTYDALNLLLAAMETAGDVEGEAVARALAATSGYRGATGVVSFDGGGDPRRSAVISSLRDGRVSLHRVVHP